MDRRQNINQIVEWIRPAFARCDAADLAAATADELGTDDAPTLTLTERTYTEEQHRGYGEWGCVREVRWNDARRADGTLDADAIARAAAEYVVAFVRSNGRVRLALQGTVLNRVPLRELVVEAVAE